MRLPLSASKPHVASLKTTSQIINRKFSQTVTQNDIAPFTRRLFKLPPVPNAPSQNHNDLHSFLQYALRTGLEPSTTTYVGTHYEYTVQQALRQYGISLHRVGGRDDAGVDLVGTWHIPQTEHPIRVFMQCKALRKRAGPNLVRELEGSFRSLPAVGWRTLHKAAVLVCPTHATKGIRDGMARSSYPLVWLMVGRDGTLQQALWNANIEKLGMGMLGVETLHGGRDAPERRIGLTWDGTELPHMDRVEEDMLQLQEKWLGLWGWKGMMDESTKMQLLDVVEEYFPGEKPLSTGPKKVCSTLSNADRAFVLEELERRRRPVHVEGQPT